jgi:hypothetical protein
MRAKIYVLAGVVLMAAAGAAWAYSVSNRAAPAADSPVPSDAATLGCCETGDCCCPGQGSCCDQTQRLSPEVVKSLKRSESCCETGNCCCPGAGSCCAAKASPDDKPACCKK